MSHRTIWLLLLLMVSLSALAYSRSKADQGFPDYNHIEYAKPLPPVDQQVAQPVPGSIHMIVGGKKETIEGTSLDSLPVSVRGTGERDSGEPSFDFLDASGDTPALSTTTTHVVSSTTTH